MKVFISWSGSRSHQIALALRDWLPTVLPYAAPWVSSEDIPKGARWTIALGSELEATRFGIICFVPENLGEPWIVFEAGAMSRSIDAARVAPFLVGVGIKDVPGPLAQFQCTVFEKEDVRKLLHSINRAADASVDPKRLDQAFEDSWPGLADRVRGIEKVRSGGVLVRERVVSPAAPHENLFKEPGGLPREQVAILTALAKHPDAYPTADDLAHAFGEHRTRTEYHLDRLRERRLIDHRLVAGEPAAYYLTNAGRAYVVENNLI
jgi:DNA-binding transcriptional ArsR family regulator